MDPDVSVVLPAHNAAATIARAVASIQAQTFPDWELLAIDDASTDATRQILLELAASDGRVRVLHLDRPGLGPALVAGLAAARAPFVARMDAADEAHPERLAQQTAYLHEHPDIGVVGCQVALGGERGAGAGPTRQVAWLNTLVTPEQIALNRFVAPLFPSATVLFRRHLAEEHGGYREEEWPEEELWLRWLDAEVRMAKVPRMLHTWRGVSGRLVSLDPSAVHQAHFRLKIAWLAEALRRLEHEHGLLARYEHGPEVALPLRPVYFWGGGRAARQFADALAEQDIVLAGHFDEADGKAAKPADGPPPLTRATLPAAGRALVLGYGPTPGARERIRAELTRRSYREGRDFLLCA